MAVGDDSERSLRIAIISTCSLATPPRAYGGTELVVAELARGLRSIGHRPIVFATGDSTCTGARSALFEHGVWPQDQLAELRHAAAAWEQISTLHDVDVVHVHHAVALPFTKFVPVPTVATVHHDREQSLADHYAAYLDVAFVAISRRQAELSWEVPFRAVVHHGLEVERYPLGAGGPRCAFLGRLAHQKAPHLAIDAARRARLPIVLAGQPHAMDGEYFAREVKPRIGADAIWVGEVDHERKVELLSNSCCLVFPIQWEEPFGLVMIEAMLVGTPVVAFACGAAPEVVEEGVTGFLASTLDELCMRIRDVQNLDRRACRARARARWGAHRMAREYATVYRDAIDSWSATQSGHTFLRGGDNGAALTALRR